MRRFASVSRRAALLGILCATVLALACCGGGSSGSPSGGLLVAADFVSTYEAIYRVDVTQNFFPYDTFTYDLTATPSDWIDPGETLVIDEFPPGSYTVDVHWTDGAVFPTFTDTHTLVDVLDGLDTTEHFPS